MPPRANLRKRAAASKPSPAKKVARTSTRQPRKTSGQTGTRLKLVLSSSSSSSKPSLADTEADENDLMLSGEELQDDEDEVEDGEESEEDDEEDLEDDEEDEEEDDDLGLESSPVRLSPRRSSGKLQLKISKIKLSQPSSNSSSSPITTDAEGNSDEEDLEEDSFEDEEEETEGPDLSKMTARQKAKLEQESRMFMDIDDVLPSTGSTKKPGLTEEEILKRAEKSRRRKIQQDQKMEEHKHATIQRLLMKQGAKSKKMKLEQGGEGNVSVESLGNQLAAQKPFEGCRYISSKETTCLLITDEKAFEQVFAPKTVVKTELTCSAPGCRNPKKYTHAQVNRPVCSLKCYKLVH